MSIAGGRKTIGFPMKSSQSQKGYGSAGKGPFMSAQEAWKRLEDELERWEMQLEAERSAVCPLDLGHRGGRHRYNWECRPPTPRLGDWIVVYGTRFRKDGTIGKLKKTFSLRFESEKTNATK